MKKSRFGEEQMVKILREADCGEVAETGKRHSISDQTIYVWRKRFGSMTPDDAKRLKAVEGENTKLIEARRGGVGSPHADLRNGRAQERR